MILQARLDATSKELSATKSKLFNAEEDNTKFSADLGANCHTFARCAHVGLLAAVPRAATAESVRAELESTTEELDRARQRADDATATQAHAESRATTATEDYSSYK